MRVSRSGAVRSAMRPHSKRRAQPLLERQDRLRRPVRAQDDLLAVLVDGVERVEELLLGPLLVGDELDVVDEEQVDPAVAGPELVDLALLDRGDELVGELLGRRVDDALARELGRHLVADGVHQVGLAEAHPAVQEERVVGVARALRHRQARRVGEAVGRADDEVRERVAGVDVAGPALAAADPARLDADLGVVAPGAPLRRVRRFAGQQLGADRHADPTASRVGPPRRRRRARVAGGRPSAVGVSAPGSTARRRSRPGRRSRRSGRGSARSATGSGSPASPWRSRSAPRSGSACRRPRRARCRAARSRSSRARGSPGARRGRRARPASRP